MQVGHTGIMVPRQVVAVAQIDRCHGAAVGQSGGGADVHHDAGRGVDHVEVRPRADENTTPTGLGLKGSCRQERQQRSEEGKA